jgi:hypothetical protein
VNPINNTIIGSNELINSSLPINKIRFRPKMKYIPNNNIEIGNKIRFKKEVILKSLSSDFNLFCSQGLNVTTR